MGDARGGVGGMERGIRSKSPREEGTYFPVAFLVARVFEDTI